MKSRPYRKKTPLIQLGAAIVALGTAQADVFTVTNANDNGPGSLRENLILAQSDSDHTILFNQSLNGETIKLTTGNLSTVRDPGTVLTIDASNLENGLTVDANNATRHLVQIGANARLDITGIAFIFGRGPDGGGNDGGSINASGSLLVLTDCHFTDNRSGDGLNFHPAGGNGGAVYSAGSVSLNRCQFERNRAGDGFASLDSEGGRGGDGGAVFAELTGEGGETTFVENRAGDGGSSEAADENAGRGGNGGALHFSVNSFFGIFDTEFIGNKAGDGGSHTGDELGGTGGAGGAIFLEKGIPITKVAFIGNSAGQGGSSNTGQNGGGGRGGAIVHFGGYLRLQSAVLHQNQAGDAGQGVGAMDGIPGDGGAVFSIPVVDGSLSLTNCIVSENRGKAILLFGGEGDINSSTIVGNTDQDVDDPALFVTGGATLTLRNSILGGNTAGPNGDVRNMRPFVGAVILEEGTNFDGLTVPVDLTADPLGADAARFGVPLPGQSAIIDRISLPDAFVTFEDIRGARRPFGGLADLGAVEAEYRPDQLVGKILDPNAMLGDDIYTVSGNEQEIKVRQKDRQKKSTFISVRNDGDIDNLTLRGKTKQRGLKVKVFRLTGGLENATAAVALIGHTTANVRHNETVLYRVVTKKKGKDRRVKRNLSFDLTSSSPGVALDRSQIRVIARQ